MAIKRVGVIGCGAMGSGIVQVVLQSGYNVLVMETDQSLLDNGLARVQGGFQKLVKKETMSSKDKEQAIERLSGTMSLKDLKDCDLVIEAVFEDIQVKLDLFKVLDGLCKEDAIFASNTSSLSITRMAGASSRKERFIGIHFFNPVPVMPLVEIVKTISTDADVLQTALEFTRSLGKVPVIARDNAGFIVNLLLTPLLLDAMRAASSGVASIQDIDTAMKLGLNHPMGPLMLSDFIGLDLIFNAANTMFEEYKESRYGPPPLLRKMVMLGYLGLKTRRGFYDWSDPKNPKPVDPNP
jgi:3-hydroxybutyryl-CoA dehydrogenase